MEINKKNSRLIVKCCYDHLFAETRSRGEEVSRREINGYLKPKRAHNLKDVFRQMVQSLQNANMIPNVIKLKQRNRGFLLNYNYEKILSKYNGNPTRLRTCMKELNPDIKSNEKTWRNFSEGIVDAARWVRQFKDFDSFKKYLKVFQDYGDEGITLLAESIGDGRIKGLRFTLALDFLKELGLKISSKCAKPDVHVMETLKGVGFIKKKDEREAFKAIKEIATRIQKPEYWVDKLIWLSCSGNFYNKDKRYWSKKEAPKYRAKLIRLIKAKQG